MTNIACPGSHTFTSTRTRSSTGVFAASNRRDAVSAAHTAVLNDLRDQVNASSCADGCLKSIGPTNAPTPGASCTRYWWTLWIVIRCTATASGSVEVRCDIQG